jgi:outer membrane protein assembly factor BamA
MFLLLHSCSVTKKLDPGEELYTGAEIDIENSGFFEDRSLKGELKEATTPEPNTLFLGVAPLKLWMYNLANDTVRGKGLQYWLKHKAGEAPVLYEPYYKERSLNNLKNKLFGKGYFEALVVGEKKISGKKVSMRYEVTKNAQYFLDTIIYQRRPSQSSVPFDAFAKKSLLQKDKPYDIDALLEERSRISERLQDSGYYYFSADYLIYKIDSSQSEKTMKLYMTLKNSIPPHALKRYRIGRINVYPDYSLQASNNVYDSSRLKDINYYSRISLLEHDILDRSIMLRKGDYYSDEQYTATLNKLMGLGIFKFANIRFNRDTNTSKADLNMDIFLTQQVPKSIRAEMQAVSKSNDYSGPYLFLTYLNRNTFRRAEELKLDLKGGLESQWTNTETNSFSYEFGTDISLSFPRFIFPYIGTYFEFSLFHKGLLDIS